MALRSLDGRNVALQFVSSQVLHSSRCPRCAVAQGLRRTHIRLSGAIRPERPRCCLGFSISSRVVGLHWVTVIVMFILITIITQGAHRINDARGRVCSQGIRSPGIAARRAASGTWQQHMAHPAGLGFMITGCNRSPTFPVLVAVPLSCFCSCCCLCG